MLNTDRLQKKRGVLARVTWRGIIVKTLLMARCSQNTRDVCFNKPNGRTCSEVLVGSNSLFIMSSSFYVIKFTRNDFLSRYSIC
jgi:hypothetical protein